MIGSEMRIRTRSWAQIEGFYLSCAGKHPTMFAGLFELVRHVARADYSAALFPYTSVNTLVLAQTSEVLDGQERLMIHPLGDGRLWFALSSQVGWPILGDRPPLLGDRPDWNRVVAADSAIQVLTRFLDRIGWVSGTGH